MPNSHWSWLNLNLSQLKADERRTDGIMILFCFIEYLFFMDEPSEIDAKWDLQPENMANSIMHVILKAPPSSSTAPTELSTPVDESPKRKSPPAMEEETPQKLQIPSRTHELQAPNSLLLSFLLMVFSYLNTAKGASHRCIEATCQGSL